MTFLAPAFLVVAAGLSAAVVVLHLLSTRPPSAAILPTARFVPLPKVEPSMRAVRLRDVGLLALRVAIVLILGAALARPVINTPRRPVARVVIVDRSRAVGNVREAVDSAQLFLDSRGTLVAFDSAATVSRVAPLDTLRALSSGVRRGNVSAALVVALRAASTLRSVADSIELVMVSPLVGEELDAATDSIRALWPGSIRVVRVAARTDTVSPAPALVAGSDDPIRFALDAPLRAPGGATMRVVRHALGADDSTWTRSGDRVTVVWPTEMRDLESFGWSPLPHPDTVGAVVAGDAVVVAPFERTLAFAATRSVASTPARWVDGTPAAVEEKLGSGCVRTVAIPIPTRGDLVLDRRFHRFVAAMLAPCGGVRNLVPVPAELVAHFSAPSQPMRVARAAIAAPPSEPSWLTGWLLAVGLLLLALETIVRARPGPAMDRAS